MTYVYSSSMQCRQTYTSPLLNTWATLQNPTCAQWLHLLHCTHLTNTWEVLCCSSSGATQAQTQQGASSVSTSESEYVRTTGRGGVCSRNGPAVGTLVFLTDACWCSTIFACTSGSVMAFPLTTALKRWRFLVAGWLLQAKEFSVDGKRNCIVVELWVFRSFLLKSFWWPEVGRMHNARIERIDSSFAEWWSEISGSQCFQVSWATERADVVPGDALTTVVAH